jgi:branched-chain amino acid transport system substrate-binding protein
MKTKKLLLLIAAVAMIATSSAQAEKKYDTGATDSEIKIGNTGAYTGAISVFSKGLKAMAAYYKMVNDNGGINGRKINFISLDDGFNPALTVAQTRKLVESDGVLFMGSPLATVPALSVRQYLNEKKIPTLFIWTSSPTLNEPAKYPYTFIGLPDQVMEMNTYVDYIVANYPNAKIAYLGTQDEFGSVYLNTLKERLKYHNKGNMLVKAETHNTTAPTITSQMISLKESGATVFLNMTIAKFSIQAIRELQNIDWHPITFVYSAASRETILAPAGLDNSKGVISVAYTKDPADPQWENDADMKAYKGFVSKYLPGEKVSDQVVVQFYIFAANTVGVLKACGDNLTRENILKVANHWKSNEPLFMPGITGSISPDDHRFFKNLKLVQFDGAFWKKLPEGKAAK